jgi:hypothetical protein
MIRTPIWAYVLPLVDYTYQTHLEDFELGSNLSLLEKPQEGLEWAGSSCFLNTERYGRILNTRIMNYWMYPNGYYRFHEDDKILRTRNILSFINTNGQANTSFPVREKLGENVLKRHNPSAFSQGLEDVRLWTVKDSLQEEHIRFICTNVNYSPTGNGRMIVGDLDIYTNDLSDFIDEKNHWIPVMKNAINVVSPRESWMEKNWVPLVINSREHFIYQWSPFELGVLNQEGEMAKLDIVQRVECKNPTLFEKIRGSSCFIPFPSGYEGNCGKIKEEWLGVVHMSEEGLPRKYYHMLVSLDENGIPCRYSSPFEFCQEGIEFCIGFETFAISSDDSGDKVGLRFWISRHDRDPAILTIPMHHIPLTGWYRLSNPQEPEIENITLEIKDAVADVIETVKDPTTPIHIYVLCYNEELLIPHTIAHYRRYLPSAVITIYDNESTDRSAEIARTLGCEVVSWNSENIQNEYIQRDMRNNIWKKGPENGWKMMIDMDEWLCVTESELREEEAKGTTILRVKGVNVMGQSQSPNLEDMTFDDLESLNRVVDWSQESKNLCFLTPLVREMNYTHGAHACFPNGPRIQFSEKRYYNKHMENLGLPFFIQKFVRRAERNKIMHAHQINLHYTDDIKKITDRYEELMGQSYVLESFDRFST